MFFVFQVIKLWFIKKVQFYLHFFSFKEKKLFFCTFPSEFIKMQPWSFEWKKLFFYTFSSEFIKMQPWNFVQKIVLLHLSIWVYKNSTLKLWTTKLLLYTFLSEFIKMQTWSFEQKKCSFTPFCLSFNFIYFYKFSSPPNCAQLGNQNWYKEHPMLRRISRFKVMIFDLNPVVIFSNFSS